MGKMVQVAPYSGDMLRWWPGLEGDGGHPGPEGLDELAHHAVVAQQLGDVHDSVAVVPLGDLAEEPQPAGGSSIERGWPSRPLASMPPHPPAEDAQAVDRVVCESVPTSVSE